MTVQFSPLETEQVAQRVPVRPSRNLYRSSFKRVLDITLTLIAAPVVVPIVAVMALLIACDGHNPFYSQMRVGKNGKSFRMWKLRTMVHNADQLLEAYLAKSPAARLEWDAMQKLKKDPRITWVGRLLRKTSMDELPQLWNVLTGDMSLVGPRPMMLCQRKDYHGQSYYNLQPGITGMWQVSERNTCNFEDRVEFDDSYDRSLSFGMDVSLLLRTVKVVLRGTGY